MALTGAVGAAVRQFAPYPEFATALVFKGRPATGGRPFYKHRGIIAPRFEMLPGAFSLGNAGLAWRPVNGAMRRAAADEPVIGDDGILHHELRTNSIRNPTFQNAGVGTPGSDPSYMNLAVQGLTRTILGRGEEFGLPYLDVRISGTNTGSTQPVTWFLDSEGKATVPGQTWTHRTGFRVLAGDWTGFASAILRIYEQAGPTFLASSTTTSLFDVGTSFASRVREHTVAQPTADNVRAVVSMGVAVGGTVDITLRMYGPQFKLGPDINDPPILQTTGLPATRTGVAQGLLIEPPPAFEVRGRFKLSALPGAGFYRRVVSLNNADGLNEAQVFVSPSNRVKLASRRNGVFQADIGSRVISAGDVVDYVATFRADGFALTVNDQAAEFDNTGLLPEGLTRLHLGYAYTPGATSLNGAIADMFIREVAA